MWNVLDMQESMDLSADECQLLYLLMFLDDVYENNSGDRVTEITTVMEDWSWRRMVFLNKKLLYVRF